MAEDSLNEALIVKGGEAFRITREELMDLFHENNTKEKQLEKLAELGHVGGLLSKLLTNTQNGIDNDEAALKTRSDKFGLNIPSKRKTKNFWQLILEQLKDHILQILIVAAVISLVIGLIQEPEDGWMEGTAILIAVCLVVFVSAGNDAIKQKQFERLNAQSELKQVNVVRGGIVTSVDISELLVGDILNIKTGDQIPVDGVLTKAVSIKCNQSNITGEADNIKKDANEPGQDSDCFMLSGSQVEEGSGEIVVCAVGDYSRSGQARKLITAQSAEDDEGTFLQQKLEKIANDIGKLGALVALLTIVALLVHLFVDKFGYGDGWDSDSWTKVIEAFIIGVTIIVVAVPEGLPLAVTISLAYSVGRMRKENNLVRQMHACETMGSVDNICSDKTGTLTENVMTVTRIKGQGPEYEMARFEPGLFDEEYSKLLCEGICENSDAHITKSKEGDNIYSGNRSECALLQFAEKLGYDYHDYRKEDNFIHRIPFSSATKNMSTIVKHEEGAVIYCKGASEVMLNQCTKINKSDGIQDLDTDIFQDLQEHIIDRYASETLRTLTLGYKIISEEDIERAKEDPEWCLSDLILLGIVGIMDPLRHNVPKAVQDAGVAEIRVRMVTGDNIETAMAIAKQAGILPQNFRKEINPEAVMLGETFRNQITWIEEKDEKSDAMSYTIGNEDVFRKITNSLCVLARSSPQDKFKLVTGLKQIGACVAVTGDGTNDAPALRSAHVGLAMNKVGTDVAKEAADIILLDDDFCSIVTAVKWGRNIYDCVRKFIQFQLTVNIVALILCFIGSVIIKKSPLTAVQMLWVNLIMDTFAALALSTEPPSDEVLRRPPVSTNEYIVSQDMWKNIIGQSIYQVVWLCVILFAGDIIFVIPSGFGEVAWDLDNGQHFTIFFNAFVFMQVFNEINSRKLKSTELNVFKNFFNNYMFFLIIIFTIVVQIILVQFGGKPLKLAPLGWETHLICIAIGAGCILWGFVLKFIPSVICKCKFNEKPISKAVRSTTFMSALRRNSMKVDLAKFRTASVG